MKYWIRLGLVSLVCVFGMTAAAQEENILEEAGLEVVKANSLDELLKNIQDRRVVENREHASREAEFKAAKENQQRLLNEARAEQQRLERRSEQLDTQYESNEVRIGDLQELLDDRLGSLRELFGVLQQVAGDARGNFEGSIISLEIPGREAFLADFAARMGTASELASIDEMEEIWSMLQQQMIESSKVSSFSASINMLSGNQVATDVVRVGEFNLVGPDGYINFDVDLKALTELSRQPSAEFTGSAEDLYEADPGELVGFALDPTRGSLLSLEIQRATLGEMVGTPFGGIATGKCYLPFCDGQGGIVGSIIILVGIVGVLLALERLVSLFFIARKVNTQKENPGEPDPGNPLGRVIGVYHNNRDIDTETLQLKMGEAVLQETPKISRNIAIVQVISVVAPLMGLLGTVIGMIQTFQAITLYGTGDPKIMASGISTALMTTVLGLCVAIPTVLLHALTHQRSRSLIHVLDEQSEGIIAQHAEEAGAKLG
ncbi:MAG: energy transducer TonB [Gammaproteobacteria bacterium]|nr:energy transducer TonB [Gammaproteobacteria bacterium]